MAKRKKSVGKPRNAWLRMPAIGAAQASQLVGILAAMAVVVLVNVIVARRYTRWDLTADKRYTLSPATVQTLHDLPDTVQIWVLLGSADPLQQSVKQLLVAYQAETTKLEVHTIDPDRDTLALEGVRKRFKIETGRTEEGHVVADAVVVVARGDRHWFVTGSEMVEQSASDQTRVKPREERALTRAIRSVLGGTKSKVCFTSGHGEASPLDIGDRGAGPLKSVLEKDNYDVTIVDLAAPGNPKPLDGCSVAVIAGLRGAFGKDEAERIRTWLLADGNLFVAASPIIAAGEDAASSRLSVQSAGLERVLAPFGIALEDAIAVEQDPELMVSVGQARDPSGLRFVAQPREHPVTTALVKLAGGPEVPRVIVDVARPMRRITEPGAATPREVLITSARAFGVRSIEGSSEWKNAPKKSAGDLTGPLTIAMASERPATSRSASHGPRVVVVGAESVLLSPTFGEPLPFRGGALFVENAISWLTATPQVLDVPEKATVSAGIRIDEQSRGTIRRYVVLFMPATVALLGIAIALFRRAGEGAPRKTSRPRKPKSPE